jgi:predicted RNase H-like HicB family nuclease
MQNIREAIDLYVGSLIAHHEPLPEEQFQVKSVPVSV